MLLKLADPSSDVVVFERNRPGDTFGFGVVFSDATLRGIDDVDPVLLRALTDHGVHWTTSRSASTVSGGAAAATGWPPSPA